MISNFRKSYSRIPGKLVLFLMVICGFAAPESNNGLQDRSEALIRKIFADADSVIRASIRLSDSLLFAVKGVAGTEFSDPDVVIHSVYHHDTVIAYGFQNSVRSKSSRLKFLVIIDISGKILALELLETPDPKSAMLQSRFWKKQFRGKSADQLRKIDVVSGATISSHDIINAVRRILAFYQLRQ